LIYDWYERCLFQDHIFPVDTDLDSLQKATHQEWGDFIDQPYQLLGQPSQEEGRAEAGLIRQGNIWAPGGPLPLSLEKKFSLGPGPHLEISYFLEAPQPEIPALYFGVELNFSFLSGDDSGKRLELAGGEVFGLDKPAQAQDVSGLSLANHSDGFKVGLTFSEPARIWCFPVETVSQSESGLERTYQGSSLTLIWDHGGGPISRRLDLRLSPEDILGT
jgi:alpha-amylase